MVPQRNLQSLILQIYDIVVDAIIIGLVMLMLIALAFAFADVVENMIHMIPVLRGAASDEGQFRSLVENVLDVFIVIELFSTFTGYVREHYVSISTLLDVTIVFSLREILVKLYAQSFSVDKLIGLCVIVIILVIARSIAAHFPPHRVERDRPQHQH